MGKRARTDRLGFKGGGQESVTAGLHEFFAERPAGVEDDCKHSKRRYAVLLYNQAKGIPGEDIRENLDSMQAALQMNGYEVVSFAQDHDSEERVFSIDIGVDNGRGLYRVRHFVSKHEDERSCCDEIVVYYTGSVGIEQTRRGCRGDSSGWIYSRGRDAMPLRFQIG